MSVDPEDPLDKPSFIPTDHLAAVGRIANAWAALELAIDRVTWSLAKVPDMYGACMTAQMLSINSKWGAMMALSELRGVSENTIKKWKTFKSKKISPMQERRNRVVHDTRMIKDETQQIERLQITAQGDLIFGFQEETMRSLHATRKDIEALIYEFQKMRDDLAIELQTLPEKSPRQLFRISHNPQNS